MNTPKRRYTNAVGRPDGSAHVAMYRKLHDDDLVSVKCASMVLGVRLQAVIKLGLPRHLVDKLAAYRKRDIQALLIADRAEPNQLLRQLQEEHRQAQIKQQAHPSRRYQPTDGSMLFEEAVAANATRIRVPRKAVKDQPDPSTWKPLSTVKRHR